MISAEGLAREYRRHGAAVHAVREVTLRVDAGEMVAFLGPNGAGKSTTMRMLTTSLRPTRGRAQVAGCDLLRDPAGVRRRIGYVPQGTGLYGDNTVTDELVLQGRIHRLGKAAARRRAAELVERLDLGELRGRLTKTLSGGQRRVADIAVALVHRPALLFLDEPTAGLDPRSRAHLWEHIRSLRADTTVFFTTHQLDEADAHADRVLVIDHGRIVAEGTPDELKSSAAEPTLGDVFLALTGRSPRDARA